MRGNRSEDVLKLYSILAEQGRTDLYDILNQVKEYQGIPSQSVSPSNQTLFGQSIATGLLEKCSTTDRLGGNKKDFMFFPIPQLKMKSTGLFDPFDKVKAIISCIRHGQHYATVTTIRSPQLILQKLLDKGYLNPHSESPDQYSIIEKMGIVKTVKQGTYPQVFLIQSDENKEAIQNSIEIISEGDVFTKKIVDKEAQSLLVTGSLIDPIRNRARVREEPKLSDASLKDAIERLRGEKYD